MSIGELSIRIKDGQGKHSSTRAFINYPSGATLAQINTGLAAWKTALNNVTGGLIQQILLAQVIDISGLTPNTPAASIIAENSVGLSFPNVSDTHPWLFTVPARALATVSGNKAVVTEGGLIDLLTDIMGAAFTVIATGDSTFTDEDGSNLALEPYCFPSYRKVGRNVRGPNRSLGV